MEVAYTDIVTASGTGNDTKTDNDEDDNNENFNEREPISKIILKKFFFFCKLVNNICIFVSNIKISSTITYSISP